MVITEPVVEPIPDEIQAHYYAEKTLIEDVELKGNVALVYMVGDHLIPDVWVRAHEACPWILSPDLN